MKDTIQLNFKALLSWLYGTFRMAGTFVECSKVTYKRLRSQTTDKDRCNLQHYFRAGLSFGGVLVTLLILTFFSSCTNFKDIVYLHEADSAGHVGFYPYEVPEYRIQKRDVLYVKVFSMNEEVMTQINVTPSIGGNIFSSDASFYLYGYNVNDSGAIELPMVGEIQVLDKTLTEAKLEIESQVGTFLKDATVIVKLISFKYSVLGEVNRPGIYQNFNNQLTVLEAISQAGDITAFGNRSKILVLRPTNKGTQTYRLDLTETKILISHGFFLLPNDIVYVEPVKSKNFRNNIPTFSLLLTTITTFILVLNYINN